MRILEFKKWLKKQVNEALTLKTNRSERRKLGKIANKGIGTVPPNAAGPTHGLDEV